MSPNNFEQIRNNHAQFTPRSRMAYIAKYKGGWRAQIFKRGKRISKTFKTKPEAREWSIAEEASILSDDAPWPRKTLAEAISRYMAEVSPRKATCERERNQLKKFMRDYPHLASKQLLEVSSADLASWRDERLRVLTPGSCEREMGILSNLFRLAVDEWKWLPSSPTRGVRRPGENPPRQRLASPSEIRRICRHLGFHTQNPLESKSQQVALAFLISLHTAMRAGEVLQLTPDTLDVAHVRHKTQHITKTLRQIPIGRKSRKLIQRIPNGGWTVAGASLDALFRKARDRCLIHDLHFHDARATALTRLSRKVDVLTLARISGHKDLRMLLNVYYRETAESIAGRL